MGNSPAFQRAYSAQHKAQRAQDLMDAARELGTEQGVRALTLTAITQRAGVHISAVRRYYASREEILIRLTQEGYEHWTHNLVTELEGRSGLPPHQVAKVIVRTLEKQPLLCDLFTHSTLTLEHEVSYECIREFKRSAHHCVRELSSAIERASGLDHASSATLVTAAISLTATLWQAGHPAPAVVRLYAEEPALAHIGVDFVPTLTDLLTALVVGLSSTPSSASDGEQNTSE